MVPRALRKRAQDPEGRPAPVHTELHLSRTPVGGSCRAAIPSCSMAAPGSAHTSVQPGPRSAPRVSPSFNKCSQPLEEDQRPGAELPMVWDTQTDTCVEGDWSRVPWKDGVLSDSSGEKTASSMVRWRRGSSAPEQPPSSRARAADSGRVPSGGRRGPQELSTPSFTPVLGW